MDGQVETGRVDRFVTAGLVDPYSLQISQDCQYIVFPDLYPREVDATKHKGVHIMELKTKEMAIVLGDGEPGCCAFGSGVEDGQYILALGYQHHVDIYERRKSNDQR
jgi:hypothetical protein